MHLSGGEQEAEQEAERARAFEHQDVMSRGTQVFQDAGTHKMIEANAAMNLHKDMKPLYRRINPPFFPNANHARHQKNYKDAANYLDRLLPFVESMHGEVQKHVVAMHGDSEKQAEATRLEKALRKARAWASDHGEDRPGETNARSWRLTTLHPKQKKMMAAESIVNDVVAEMKRNPNVLPPLRPVKDGGKKHHTRTTWGESSHQRH